MAVWVSRGQPRQRSRGSSGFFAIAIERLLIFAKNKVGVRNDGVGMGIEVARTKMRSERAVQLVAIAASLDETGKELGVFRRERARWSKRSMAGCARP